MENFCSIPMHYRQGEYRISQLPGEPGDSLQLNYEDEYELLCYKLPEVRNPEDVRSYELNVTVYGVEPDFLSRLSLVYDENDHLQKISLGDRLIYIYFADEEQEKSCLLAAGRENAEAICSAMKERTEPVPRMFVEYFYDGEAFDFAVKPCSEKDVQTAQELYGSSEYSGNFPVELRVKANTALLGLMLRCCDPRRRDDLCRLLIDTMLQPVRALAGTADFELIENEYD